MKTLAQILAEKKAASASSAFIEEGKNEPEKPSSAFPLALLLSLYYQADKHDVYTDYMSGFKALAEGLGPIAIPPPPYPPLLLPLYNYEQQEIAKILRCPPEAIQSELISLLGFSRSKIF